MNIQNLKLDSDISGFKIGKYVLRKPITDVYEDLRIEFNKYDIVYFITKFDENIVRLLENYDCNLADTKITLSQNIKQIRFNKLVLNREDFFNKRNIIGYYFIYFTQNINFFMKTQIFYS